MIFKYLSLFTGICYIVMGVVMLVYRTSFKSFDPTLLLGFGIIIILYGLFRIWNGVLKLKNKEDEESN